MLAGSHFAASVGVERYEYPVYSERLLASLRSTGLFEEVQPLSELDEPDLIASVERPVHGTASMIPLLTIVTLGVVPTIVDEEWGESCCLRSAGGSGSEVAIEFTYSGPTTLGWAALLRALSPKHAFGKPQDTARFQLALAATIAENESEINQLLKQ